MKNIEKAQAKFDEFILEMDDALEALVNFVESLNDNMLLPLDYSWDSLDRIESLLALYFDDKIIIEISEDKFITRIARYLGETLRKRMGGVWKLCEDPKDFAFGLPTLGEIKNMNPQYAYNPFDTIETYKIRRVKGLIRRAVFSHTKYTIK
ncbi:hypothetical protein GCM10009118_21260 [Wandonia haliotis]|uniref:Uncharacterized protein n=1 Tax=Wandonia haliotis TaxID=574963 RepID=A0ABN1MRE6_9FLAO